MTITPPRIGPQPWDIVRTKLDQSLPFANMRDTPYYRDAVWEQFSKAEYARRYTALRAKMREEKLDVVIVPGGPSHWSFGGGMLWLTGHWEWHALASYVLVPHRGRADADLFNGRHACRSRAAARRCRGAGRAPQSQRPLCRHHGRAHSRAQARARPHRTDGDRPAPRGLPAGQPI